MELTVLETFRATRAGRGRPLHRVTGVGGVVECGATGSEEPRVGGAAVLVADGNLGIWAAARQVWPEAGEQRYWNHKMVKVLDRLPKREQREAKRWLWAMVYAPSRAEAAATRNAFGDAILDRLLNNAHCITLKGTSMRRLYDPTKTDSAL